MIKGLPVVSIKLEYWGLSIELQDVLVDTGSSNTIFDVDLANQIGIEIDPVQGKAKRMYGVGGESELCYEQPVSGLIIDGKNIDCFILQLGITKDTYGFDGILGSDYFSKYKSIIDFNTLEVMSKSYNSKT